MEFKVYGSGGIAKVIKDLILLRGYLFGGNFDDADPELEYIFNVNDKSLLVIGVGNNQSRERIANSVKHQFGTLIHPAASVSKDAELGEGTVVLAGAVVQAGARIGKHVIINANVVIDHDAVVEDFASIYPGTYVAGAATVKARATVPPHTVIPRQTSFG